MGYIESEETSEEAVAVIYMGLERDLALRGGAKTETQGRVQESLQEKKRRL